MRQLIGIFLMIGGMAALVTAGYRQMNNNQEEKAAEQFAVQVLQRLEEAIVELPPDDAMLEQMNVENSDALKHKEAYFILDNLSYLGVLDIPDLNISLPVLSDYDEQTLKQAPCRYSGTVAGGDLIIAGHNYRKHFSPIRSVEIGTEVIFTDAMNVSYKYVVDSLETIDGMAVKDMKSGEWDLTLFTCTLRLNKRVAVRCKLAE